MHNICCYLQVQQSFKFPVERKRKVKIEQLEEATSQLFGRAGATERVRVAPCFFTRLYTQVHCTSDLHFSETKRRLLTSDMASDHRKHSHVHSCHAPTGMRAGGKIHRHTKYYIYTPTLIPPYGKHNDVLGQVLVHSDVCALPVCVLLYVIIGC